jgi:hypothetical protein
MEMDLPISAHFTMLFKIAITCYLLPVQHPNGQAMDRGGSQLQCLLKRRAPYAALGAAKPLAFWVRWVGNLVITCHES